MKDREVVDLLTLSQSGVVMIIAIQATLHILWCLCDLIPGFALFDGPVGAVSAYSHTAWWMSIDLITLLVGIGSIYFGLNYVAAPTNVVERGLGRNENWLIIYMMILGLDMISFIVHAVLSLFELAACQSTLCVGNQWVLIVFVVGLLLDTLLLGWGILRAYSLLTNLRIVLTNNWSLLIVWNGDSTQANPVKRMIAMPLGMPLIHKMK